MIIVDSGDDDVDGWFGNVNETPFVRQRWLTSYKRLGLRSIGHQSLLIGSQGVFFWNWYHRIKWISSQHEGELLNISCACKYIYFFLVYKTDLNKC